MFESNAPAGTATILMQEQKRVVEKDSPLEKDDLIVVTGAGGLIASNLALYFNKHVLPI